MFTYVLLLLFLYNYGNNERELAAVSRFLEMDLYNVRVKFDLLPLNVNCCFIYYYSSERRTGEV